MTEKELIEQFSLFGYYALKIGGKYSVFDRRNARRIYEFSNLKQLSDHAENVGAFGFWTEILNRTVQDFKEILSPVTVPESQPEQDTVTGKEQDPEQEDSPPAVPESGLFEKICPTCGKTFQTPIKQRKYCSERCYPSEVAKRSKNGSEVG